MGKIRINKNDHLRILLTELLPYEVPVIFSNEGFYRFHKSKDKKSVPPFISRILINTKKYSPKDQFIPFEYKIKKSAYKSRTLSIMHPAVQNEFVSFYDKYDLMKIHLCTRSSLSLRFPSKVASHFYYKKNISFEKDGRDEGVEVESNDFDGELTYSSSYFSYKKYNLLSRFYDSYEFLRLEKKFKYLLTFDISKCFNSIYTHTIAWAVKDKDFAKRNIGKDGSFENIFDALMQKANYKETNGILIGPEISRIFAEIILQRVDLNIVDRLNKSNNKGEIFLGKNYAIRRYVDDYFVFTNDKKLESKIYSICQEELAHFKLHINESKTKEINIPFITGITIARNEIRKTLDEFFEKYLLVESVEGEGQKEEKVTLKDISKIGLTSSYLIRDIKCIVSKNAISYETVASQILSIVRKHLLRVYRNINLSLLNEKEKYSLLNFILIVMDFIFFVFSMDCRVRTTYLISQIIIYSKKYFENEVADIKHPVYKKITDEVIYLIKNMQDEDDYSVEVLNLLIVMKALGDDYLFEQDLLMKVFRINKKDSNINYFHIVVILYYISDLLKYAELRHSIELIIRNQFQNDINLMQKAELTLAFFDIIRCPYISRNFKEDIVEIVYKKIERKKPSIAIRNRIINYIEKKNWFINWNSAVDFESILIKKELRTPY